MEAGRLGLKEQQIQRYEASDYASASFTRIKRVVSALGIKLDDVLLADVTPFTDEEYHELGIEPLPPR